MKLLFIFFPFIMTSCGALNTDFFKAADDVLTDGVVKVQVDKEAFTGDREVVVIVKVTDPKERE